MKRFVERFDRFLILMIVLCSAVVFSVAALSWALYDRFTETNHRRQIQMRLNLDMCREIEKLKTARRDQATASFTNRKRDFALLGIPLTVELEDRIRENYHTTLERFRREPCPRPIGDNRENQ